jgi:hypothetical protein
MFGSRLWLSTSGSGFSQYHKGNGTAGSLPAEGPPATQILLHRPAAPVGLTRKGGVIHVGTRKRVVADGQQRLSEQAAGHKESTVEKAAERQK